MSPSKANPKRIPWPHAPLHKLSDRGTYFLTAGTYRKDHFFRGAKRLSVLHRGLLKVAEDFGWWHNFWETRLTYEKSYLVRLNYVHQKPVKHGLVQLASQYLWCSAGWFERTARAAQVKTIYSLKLDKVKVYDEYEPALDW